MMLSKTQKDYLSKIWYNPKNVGGFTGPSALYDVARRDGKFKISKQQITDWLQNQDPYSVRRQIHSKKRTVKTPLVAVDHMWDADLADVSNIKEHNDGIRFLLVVIDMFSRYAWVLPLKDKKASTVLEAFKTILSERKPTTIRTDHGSEFMNKWFKNYCKSKDIFLVGSHSAHKAAFAESFIGKLKNIMYRYFQANQTYRFTDVLTHMIKSYNARKHSALYGMAPKDIDEDTQYKIWSRMPKPVKKKRQKYKFKLGDQVRLTYKRRVFRRGWEQKWTEEIFTVASRYYRDHIPVYKVKDYDGEKIVGAFYGNELQKVFKDADTLWRIEKVLKTKKVKGKTLALVRWLGWPEKFNSWIDANNLPQKKV